MLVGHRVLVGHHVLGGCRVLEEHHVLEGRRVLEGRSVLPRVLGQVSLPQDDPQARIARHHIGY